MNKVVPQGEGPYCCRCLRAFPLTGDRSLVADYLYPVSRFHSRTREGELIRAAVSRCDARTWICGKCYYEVAG